MRKESHKYDITQCALYKIKSSKQLQKVLCINKTEHEDILSIVHYFSFQIDKRIVQRRELLQHQIKELRKYKP